MTHGPPSSSSAPSAPSSKGEKHKQKKSLAPAVIPDLPITKTYQGPLPDIHQRPYLLPLLRPLEDAPCASSPPSRAWNRLRARHNAKGRVPFDASTESSRPEVSKWQVSTHVCPAAYPRSHLNGASPHSKTYPGSPAEIVKPVQGASTEEVKAQEKKRRQQIFDDWHSYIERNPPESYFPASSAQEAKQRAEELRASRQAQLWNVLNCYTPPSSSRDGQGSDDEDAVTVLLGHGTGLHKETWEPMLEALLQHLDGSGWRSSPPSPSRRAPGIAEIWSFDAINCGESARLNEDILGEVIHQHDHARDFHNFVAHYLPHHAPDHGPTILQRRRESDPQHPRRIVFVGHSVSASMVSLLCDRHPSLFAGIALVDPATLKFWPEMARNRTGITNGGGSQLAALVRRDVWSTRPEAIAAFQQNRAYKHWHPKALELWCRFGIRPCDPDSDGHDGGPTTLTCPKKLEAAAYRMMWLSSYPMHIWERRARFSNRSEPPQPRTLLIRVENTFLQSDALGEEMERAARAAGVDEVERWTNGEHLLVQTDPAALGRRLARWIVDVAATTSLDTGRGQQSTSSHYQREARM